MKRSEIFLMILKIPVDFLMLVLAGASAFGLRFTELAINFKPVIFKLTFEDFLSITMLVSLVWIFIFAFAGLYSIDANRKFSADLWKIILACSTGVATVAMYIMFTQQLFDSRFLIATSWVFSIIYVTIGRLLIRGLKSLLYRLEIGMRKVVVIGDNEISKTIIQNLKFRKELGYNVLAFFPNFNKAVGIEIKKKKIDEIIFTNPRAEEKETLSALEYCNENHLVFKYTADLFATYSSNISVYPLAGTPLVELKKTPLDGWGRIAKRLFDIVVSILVLIISSPILFLTCLIILIESGRPIIYKNERVGIRGRKFFTLKFRSMYQEDCTGEQFGESGKKAEKKEKELIAKQSIKEGPIYKIVDDPRITQFGKFMRRWSLDEMPQFFNVLRGSMSIVGPRPHQTREVDKYEGRYKKVLTLKPGITGLSQISGRSDLSFEEEMKLDIFYIEKWSLFLDLIIFVKTPFIVFRKRGVL